MGVYLQIIIAETKKSHPQLTEEWLFLNTAFFQIIPIR